MFGSVGFLIDHELVGVTTTPTTPSRWPSLWSALRANRSPGKVFLVGHNKCGTGSFHKLLRSNGYSSIHYDKGRFAKAIQTNFTFSLPLLEGVHKYIAYTDMELCGEFYAY